jgi:aspartyl protease family protein
VRISLSPDGHFWARAEINGRPKRLLIDSGATITALSEETARAAGVETNTDGFPMVIRTANGTIAAKGGTIELLKVGGLETRDVGVVVSPAFGDIDVIGMNFLSRLGSWRVEGRTLILEPKKRDAAKGSKAERRFT